MTFGADGAPLPSRHMADARFNRLEWASPFLGGMSGNFPFRHLWQVCGFSSGRLQTARIPVNRT